jgi:hypothetical protein
MKIPNKLKVGGHTYTILKNYHFKERGDLLGQADHTLLEIRLAKYEGGGNKISSTKREEVFIHEILHTINEVYNSGKLEEETIQRLSYGLHQVLKDNKLLK